MLGSYDGQDEDLWHAKCQANTLNYSQDMNVDIISSAIDSSCTVLEFQTLSPRTSAGSFELLVKLMELDFVDFDRIL